MNDRSRDDDRLRVSEMAERRRPFVRRSGGTDRQGAKAPTAPHRPPIVAPPRGVAPVEKAPVEPTSTWAPGVYLEQSRWTYAESPDKAFFSPIRVSDVGGAMEPFAAQAMHVAAPIGMLEARRGADRDEERLRALDPALLDAALADPERPFPYRERLEAYLDHAALESARAISGPNATRALDALDAEALAVGTEVLFRERPNLETAAHEAAHVIQALAGRRPANEREALELEARHLADSVSRGEALERYANPALGRNASAPHSRFEIIDADPERATETARLLERFAGDLGLTPSDVSVQVDEEAARKTRAHGTRGLMQDGQVLLDTEKYDPSVQDGRELLAHETIHAAQLQLQSAGVANTNDTGYGPREAESEAAALAEELSKGIGVEPPMSALPQDHQAPENGPRSGPPMDGAPKALTELKHRTSSWYRSARDAQTEKNLLQQLE